MDFELPHVLENAPGQRAAELLVDGLSVFCFNKNQTQSFWEIGFPRRRKHELTITIEKLDRRRKPVSKASYSVHPDVERFAISLTNGSAQHYDRAHFPEGGPHANAFHRDPSRDDLHDLQWMLDLAGHEIGHGNFRHLKPRNGHPRSVASIRHSLFCNLKPEEFAARISPRHGNHPHAVGSRRLGPTNTLIVGVLLATVDGDIQFEFDPQLTTIEPLPYNENTRYRMEIKNEDVEHPPHEDGFVRGDLRLFYDDLIIVSGEQKDLWAVPGPEVTPDGDCHPTILGGGRTLLP